MVIKGAKLLEGNLEQLERREIQVPHGKAELGETRSKYVGCPVKELDLSGCIKVAGELKSLKDATSINLNDCTLIAGMVIL